MNLAVSIPWLSSQDVPLAGPADVARVVAGSVAAAALFGAAGAGLGALLANQTAAVTVSLVWLLAVEGLVVSITSTPTLHEWLPGGALGVIAQGAGEGAPPLWAAAGCAVAYAGALVAAGTQAPHRSRRHVKGHHRCTQPRPDGAAAGRIPRRPSLSPSHSRHAATTATAPTAATRRARRSPTEATIPRRQSANSCAGPSTTSPRTGSRPPSTRSTSTSAPSSSATSCRRKP